MVKIRLFRTGKKNQPSYRIVAIDSRKKRNGQVLEILGFFNPKTKPESLKLKIDRVNYWLKNGAQPSESVRKLLKNGKVT